jgi:hypothetical protein
VSPGTTLAEVADSLRRLEAWGEARDWKGPDPYDGLNATRLVRPLRARPLGRRVLTQVVKRSPLDVRPLLGIPPSHNAGAIAHVVSSYARDGLLPAGEARAKLERALALLDRLRLATYDRPCWGYPFDVQTRVFFYPRGVPNSIATSFAAHALVDAYEATRERPLLELAEAIGEFFLEYVPQTDGGNGAYFGYLVGDRTPIHNANVLVCAALARVIAHRRRHDFAAAAEQGVRYTVRRQRTDGSWPYGERPNLDWVDGYHTGYVLDALMACREAGVEAAEETAIYRGLEYYRRELFAADGRPKFTSTSVYPIDSQCVAQGIQTFALAAREDVSFLDDARRVFRYARMRMQRRDGAFIFQRRRLWANRTPHVRWTAAPMLLALTHLLERERSAA